MHRLVQILKRHCRQLGVARWPHRKIKSIQGLIRAIEGFGGEDAALSNQVRLAGAFETGIFSFVKHCALSTVSCEASALSLLGRLFLV